VFHTFSARDTLTCQTGFTVVYFPVLYKVEYSAQETLFEQILVAVSR
jgi:hypothetical protein